MSARRRNLGRLLNPRHLAFVGGVQAASGIAATRRNGFTGPVWAVHPKKAEMSGVRCVASVADLPEPPDAVFLAVPRDQTIQVVSDLARMGAGGAVCYAAGFAEAGADGKAAQARLIDAAGDLAVMGPNCYGLIDSLHGVSLWPIEHRVRRVTRGPALLAQSGNLAINLSVNRRSVDFSYVIGIGNQAVLGVEDFVDVLADDPAVTAIGVYLEGLRDAEAFARAARRAAEKGVGIAAVKAGKSELGRALTTSHTASLAGSEDIYRAFFARLGVAELPSMTALLEALKMLSVTGPIEGNRALVFTCSGGENNLVADEAERLGIALPQFTPARLDAIRKRLPAFANLSNPLDYTTSLWGDGPGLNGLIADALPEPHDVAVLVIDYIQAEEGRNAGVEAAIGGFARAVGAHGGPAAIMSTLPESMPDFAREDAMARGIAPLQGMADGLAGLAAAMTAGRARRAAREGSRPLRLLGRAAARDTQTFSEWDSKRRLAEAGVPIPEGALASAAEAPDAAARLGFPVALKISSAAVSHKSELGGVRLGLSSSDAVRAAVAEMQAALDRHGHAADRFLVERMAEGGVAELHVGFVRDPVFGLVLVLASGGVLVELAADSAVVVPPFTPEAVAGALDGLKVSRLMDGFRGKPAGDRAAAVEAIHALGRFAEANADTLIELDVNPLIVLPKGVLAVDALLRTTAP